MMGSNIQNFIIENALISAPEKGVLVWSPSSEEQLDGFSITIIRQFLLNAKNISAEKNITFVAGIAEISERAGLNIL